MKHRFTIRDGRRRLLASVATAALALGALVGLIGAPVASAGVTECTSAVGSAEFVLGGERQLIKNKVSTNLESPQKLTFSWERGGQLLTLTELTAATCTVKTSGTRFHGEGEGEVNGVSGYHVGFDIRVLSHGTVAIVVRLKKGKEVLQFVDSAKVSEVIS